MDAISELENALGAELLRCTLLRRDPPRIGTRYVVERILGRGASGLVVAALDDRLNRPVALKLSAAVLQDTASLAEARALARLDHPNVVRVHDVDVVSATIDGRTFRLWLVSMQRIEGRSLRAWIKERPRSLDEIVRVFVDAGRGLAAAHIEKIVHRDIKPDNIVVRGDGVAQVLDFGFAVNVASSTHSDAGGVRPAAGTDPYMSPEARLGRATRRSDQFSFGVTLVEALTDEAMPAARRVPRHVSKALWSIVRRATAPDPEERYPRISDLLDDLERVRPDSRPWSRVLVVSGAAVSFASLALAMWNAWPLVGASEVAVAAGAADAGAPSEAAAPPSRMVAAHLERRVEGSLDAGRGEATIAAPAPPPASASEPSASCARLRRRVYDFHTTSEGSGSRHACYVLTIASQDGCDISARLERGGYGDTPACSSRSWAELRGAAFELGPDGRLGATGTLNGRQYEFDFTIAAGRLSGTFEAETPSSRYRGTVTDDRP